MYYQFLNNQCHYHRFESLFDKTEYVRSIWDRYAPMRDEPIRDGSWVGRSFNDINEVITACHAKWDHGMDAFERMLSKLENQKLEPPKSIRRRPTWSEDDGDELCLDRLRFSQPYWRTTRRSHSPGPVNVTILSDIATSSYKNHEDVLWRGAASICLTKLLEESGYRVELLVGNHLTENTYKSNHHCLTVLELKHCEDPLDESTFINAVSGWVFRTIYFAASYHEGEIKKKDLIGSPASLSRWLDTITPDKQIIICKDIWSEQAAINWIKQQLAKFANGEFVIQS